MGFLGVQPAFWRTAGDGNSERPAPRNDARIDRATRPEIPALVAGGLASHKTVPTKTLTIIP